MTVIHFRPYFDCRRDPVPSKAEIASELVRKVREWLEARKHK